MDTTFNSRDPYFIQSVANAADILRAFTDPNEVLRLRDVVTRMWEMAVNIEDGNMMSPMVEAG